MLPAAAQELWKALRKADRKAAKARVLALKKRLPDADNEELHRLLVQSKCLQAGAIGALSAVVELVPGAGKLAGVFLGSVIDIGTVTADGAYDTRRCHTAIINREATAIIPIRKNGRP